MNCRYQGCEPLILACPSCSGTFDCPSILNSISKSITGKSTRPQAEESTIDFWHKLRCPKCPGEGDVGRLSPAMIANQVYRLTRVILHLPLIIRWGYWGCTRILKKYFGFEYPIYIERLLRMHSDSVFIFQVKRQADSFVSMYYKGTMTVIWPLADYSGVHWSSELCGYWELIWIFWFYFQCDDDTCKYNTRSLNLQLVGDSERGTVCPDYPRCNGRLVRKVCIKTLLKRKRKLLSFSQFFS